MQAPDHVNQTYLVSLLCDLKVFADEVDKYRYLKRIPEYTLAGGCSAAAFTLLDDSFHVILYCQQGRKQPEDMISRSFRDYFLPYYRSRQNTEQAVRFRTSALALADTKQVLEKLLYIHFLAMQQGIVRNPNDYFWCSLPTYRKQFEWEFVRTDNLLVALSEDRRTAEKIFWQFHRKMEEDSQVRAPK